MGEIKPALWDNSSWLEFSSYSNMQGAVGGVDEVGRGALYQSQKSLHLLLINPVGQKGQNGQKSN